MAENLDKYKKNGIYQYLLIRDIHQNNTKEMEKVFLEIKNEKPICVVFGNCQTFYMTRILHQTDVINTNYNIIEFPLIQDLTVEKKTGFSRDLLKHISLFIYQNVSDDNKFSPLLSTDRYILPSLDKNCLKCSFPFVYFKGYFPQYVWNRRNYLLDNYMPYGDLKIQELIEKGYPISKCVEELGDLKLFSDKELKDNLSDTISELQKRESHCDVKISDFIFENYQEKYLFYTPSHPVTDLLIEVAKRIFKHLNIQNYYIKSESLPENDGYEMLIYPSVVKKLNLKFEKRRFRYSALVSKKSDDLKGYVEKYRKYNFPELNDDVRRTFRVINVVHMLKLNTDIISERIPSKLTLCGRQLHMSLYLNLNGRSGIIAQVPEMYAPPVSYICCAGIVELGGGISYNSKCRRYNRYLYTGR